jgi:hypothetical protein
MEEWSRSFGGRGLVVAFGVRDGEQGGDSARPAESMVGDSSVNHGP